MTFNQNWKTKPAEGYEFIYRYYDSKGKSYIGHTKQSLCSRAGGKNGKNYTRKDSKFATAITQNGFESFEFEILEEVPAEKASAKEKYYVKKFNSRKNGYNSTSGGRAYYEHMSKRPFVVDLKKYTKAQLANLKNNILVYNGMHATDAQDIDQLIKDLSKQAMCYNSYIYYVGKYVEFECHPIITIFNVIDLLVEETWDDLYELSEAMACYGILRGDLLSSGCYSSLKIILCTGEIVSLDILPFHPLFVED